MRTSVGATGDLHAQRPGQLRIFRQPIIESVTDGVAQTFRRRNTQAAGVGSRTRGHICNRAGAAFEQNIYLPWVREESLWDLYFTKSKVKVPETLFTHPGQIDILFDRNSQLI